MPMNGPIIRINLGHHDRPGGVCPIRNSEGELVSIIVACPDCGAACSLRMPPFTWDELTGTIGPASVRLPCGYHGHVAGSEWHRANDSVQHEAK